MNHAWAFDAIGTEWVVHSVEPVGADSRRAVLDHIERFDRTWSRFRPDSLITRIAREAGEWNLPASRDLFALYDDLYRATGGAMNPLVGRALSDLGYDAAYSLRQVAEPSAAPSWPEAVERDGDVIQTAAPLLIDVGAAGKGLLVDEVMAVLADRRHLEMVIDAGGDIYVTGPQAERIGLESPWDPTRALGVVDVVDQSICGSASNRRVWGDGLHHVLDARTGRPTTDVIATWVVADQAMTADALATAYFFADPEALHDVAAHAFVRVHADGRIDWSPDLPGEIF